MAIRVIPRARKTEIVGTRHDELLVRLAAAPVDDAANDALLELLASRLGLPERALNILGGRRSRHKRVAVQGATAEQIARAIGSGLNAR